MWRISTKTSLLADINLCTVNSDNFWGVKFVLKFHIKCKKTGTIFVGCDKFVPNFHKCEEYVPIPHTCEESVLNLHICETVD